MTRRSCGVVVAALAGMGHDRRSARRLRRSNTIDSRKTSEKGGFHAVDGAPRRARRRKPTETSRRRLVRCRSTPRELSRATTGKRVHVRAAAYSRGSTTPAAGAMMSHKK
jgi:hypothetical protein